MHGDLHHENILSSVREPWLAIDPKGLIGESEYEVISFLLNNVPEDYKSETNYFGAFVVVDGSYTRSEPTQLDTQSDYLIVPGKSLGKISLGMTKAEVTHLLGKPTNSDEHQMTYKSSKNYITLNLKNQVVKQIEFTSPSFSTSDGINTKNFEEKKDLFKISAF